jgi:uncharacterized protein (TIGR02145 family)
LTIIFISKTSTMRNFFLIALFISIIPNSFAQRVGIGTTSPDSSALLELKSTNSGFLPPRMTYAQRNAINNPAAGLIVWCTDCGGNGGELSVFNGTEWRAANISTTSVIGTVPLAPTNLSVTVSYPLLYATLSWTDLSTNEAGYKIERKTGNGVFTQIGQVGTNVSSYYDSTISQSNTYTYRVYAYNNAGNSAQYSNEFQVITYALPVITTTSVSAITNTTSTTGGNITSDGGATITARGVVWSTSINPTIALSTKTTDGTGPGTFTSNITGLTPNTTYYVRAYATNSVGTAYGNEISFTTLPIPTVDTTVPSITIGTQIWSTKNLDVARYRNGDPIPQVTDPTQWRNLTTGAWCWVQNDSARWASTYGRLYNWYAVNDPRGLAPQGWHVPSDGDWTILTNYLGGESVAGGKMKSTTGWNTPNRGATNSSGFAGIPGAARNSDGSFSPIGMGGFWWSAGELGTTGSWFRTLYYNAANIGRNFDNPSSSGYSVRVVRD